MAGKPVWDWIDITVEDKIPADLQRLIEICWRGYIPQPDENWNRLFHLARRHKFRTRLSSALLDHANQLPPSVAEQCQLFQREHMVAAVHRLAVIREMNEALATVNVRPIVVKGLAAGRDVRLRDIGDIDIILAEADAGKAIAALVAAGFAPKFTLAEKGFSRWREVRDLGKDFTLYRRDLPIEIHWRYTHVRRLLPVEFANELDGTQELRIDPYTTILTLAPLASFVYLSVHGAVHQWSRLHWLADIPPALGELSDPDQKRLLCWAASSGLLNVLLLGTALSERLMRHRAPGRFADAIAHGPKLNSMIRHCLEHIVAERPIWESPAGATVSARPAVQRINQMLFGLKLRDRWGYRVEYLAGRNR